MAAASIPSESIPSTDASGSPLVPWSRIENFIGQLTHDIRNGLNAVELQLTFLGEIAADPEAAEEVKRLRQTLANVTKQLQVLRAGTSAIRAYPLEYPASDFFDDLRERFAKAFPEHVSRVAWDIEVGANVMVAVDPELTLSALLELLRNAVQFAEAAKPIRLTVVVEDGRLMFALQEPQSIEPTISPEDWGRTPLLTTRRGAYGLGLFRVRRSVETQRGTMEMRFSPEAGLVTRIILPAVISTTP